MKKIVQPHQAGWGTFDLDGFHGRISYVDSIPEMIIVAYRLYKMYQSCVLTFDEEGSSFYLILTDYEAFIIHQKNETKLICLDTPSYDIIDQMYKDIVDSLDAWVEWMAPETNHELVANKRRLEKLIQENEGIG